MPEAGTRVAAIGHDLPDVIPGRLQAESRIPRQQPQIHLVPPVDDLSRPSRRHREALVVQLGDAGVAALVAMVAVTAGERRLSLLTLGWLALQLRPTLGRHRAAIVTSGESLRRSLALSFFVLAVHAATGHESGVRAEFATLVGLAIAGACLPVLIGWRPVRHRLGTDGQRRVLLVGEANRACAATVSRLRIDSSAELVGICLSTSADLLEAIAGVPVVGEASAAAREAKRLGATHVSVLPDAAMSPEDLMRLQWDLEDSGVELNLLLPLVDTAADRLRPSRQGGQFAFVLSTRRPTSLAAAVKRQVERGVAVVLLVVVAPLIVGCMLAVRLETPGGAVFRQRRVGQGGRVFTMYKIRTMAARAEADRAALAALNEADGHLFKIKQDPRVTRVGKVLRALSLDELPQLVNVLRADMSLIGPRPALPDEVEMYDDTARRRLAVKPGITGLWQVSGRSNISGAEAIRLDIDYVDNWSPALDTKIALSTLRAVISRDGAY